MSGPRERRHLRAACLAPTAHVRQGLEAAHSTGWKTADMRESIARPAQPTRHRSGPEVERRLDGGRRGESCAIWLEGPSRGRKCARSAPWRARSHGRRRRRAASSPAARLPAVNTR
eukprot:14521371-Alexandrium_andersonii.AAC.1